MNASITEIFRSIQGEGKYLGLPMVFVRFAGCDVGCAWCDTDYTLKEELPVEDLAARIRALCHEVSFISLTGGEPLLQAEALTALLPLLKKEGRMIFLETNGILYKEFSQIAEWIDIVAMDFKLPSSTGCQAFWAEHRTMLEMARAKDVFVKIVVTAQTSFADMKEAADIIASIDPLIPLYLQPNTAEIKTGALDQCLRMQQFCSEKLKDVRVVPQVHRLLGIK
jgi:7-cyano-7-deazaguanosine (preQ0) biosynthesis protein QueE